MKTETFDGEIGTAYGNPVNPKLPFAGTYEAYENYADVPKDEQLTDKDKLEVVNIARKNTARAAKITEVLDANGYKKPDPNSPEVLDENMIKTLMKRKGLTRAEAEQVVKGLVGG